MLVTLMIAFWHLGIEFQWWLPSSSCSNWDTNIGSLTEELNNNLMNLVLQTAIYYLQNFLELRLCSGLLFILLQLHFL